MGLQVIHNSLPLTEKCHHYDQLGKVPHDIKKYWHQRYDIFSFYDYDVYLTDEAWFGVTPEPIAHQIAQDLSAIYGYATDNDDGDHERYHESMYDDPDPDPTPAPQLPVVVDLFAGAGGNTIAFALSGLYSCVVAIERDPATLACAQHNAAVYGVPEGAVVWVLGDCFDFLRGMHGLLLSSTSSKNPSSFKNSSSSSKNPSCSPAPSLSSSFSPATLTPGSFTTTSFASTATLVGLGLNPPAHVFAAGTVSVSAAPTATTVATPASISAAPPALPQELLDLFLLTANSSQSKRQPHHNHPHYHPHQQQQQQNQPPELLLFGSPPWGGVSYAANNVFDLSVMQPYNLDALHGGCHPFAHAMYLPRNSDVRQIAMLAPGRGDRAVVGGAESQAGEENGTSSSRPQRKRKRGRGDHGGHGGNGDDCGGKMDVVHYCLKGASKAMVAYFPAEKGGSLGARG